MFKFIKRLFAAQTNEVDSKRVARYYVDHLRVNKSELSNGLRFAVLVQMELSANRGDSDSLFDVYVGSVELAPLNGIAKAYLNSINTNTLKSTVATLCHGAGEFALAESTPISKVMPPDRQNEAKSNDPLLPDKNALLN